MHGGAHQLVLARESLGQNAFIETSGNEIVIRRALAGQDSTAGVNKRQNDGRLQTFVFGLHVIDHTVVLNIRIKACKHCSSRVSGREWISRTSERATRTVT